MNIPTVLKATPVKPTEQLNYDWKDIDNDFDRLKASSTDIHIESDHNFVKLFEFLNNLNLKHNTITQIYDIVLNEKVMQNG